MNINIKINNYWIHSIININNQYKIIINNNHKQKQIIWLILIKNNKSIKWKIIGYNKINIIIKSLMIVFWILFKII